MQQRVCLHGFPLWRDSHSLSHCPCVLCCVVIFVFPRSSNWVIHHLWLTRRSRKKVPSIDTPCLPDGLQDGIVMIQNFIYESRCFFFIVYFVLYIQNLINLTPLIFWRRCCSFYPMNLILWRLLWTTANSCLCLQLPLVTRCPPSRADTWSLRVCRSNSLPDHP